VAPKAKKAAGGGALPTTTADDDRLVPGLRREGLIAVTAPFIPTDVHGGTMMLRWTTLFAAMLCLAGCGRIANHPIVGVAKDEAREINASPNCSADRSNSDPRSTAAANETDGIAAMRFNVKGPKGSGVVVVEGKKLGQDWGVTLLEIRPASGGDHLHITADLEERTGTDTPKFDPSAAADTPTTPSAHRATSRSCCPLAARRRLQPGSWTHLAGENAWHFGFFSAARQMFDSRQARVHNGEVLFGLPPAARLRPSHPRVA
jgi:hypothetical protein